MDYFHYQQGTLYAEKVALKDLANQFGTPCYVYSRAAIENQWHAFNNAFGNYPHRVCYAVKANSNIGILNILAKLGSGFDIVSQGELDRALIAGGQPSQIIFSGVGKTETEISHALDKNIFCFNIESAAELEHLHAIAKKKDIVAPIGLRINPNIDARTHPYIATGLHDNKFGIELKEAMNLCRKIKTMSHVNLISMGCHIGSQLTELDPFISAVDCLLDFIEQLLALNIHLQYIDIGGGLGIRYSNENPPEISTYISTLVKKIEKHKLKIILEPGRAIVGNAGVLLTQVQYLKQTEHKNFAIIDAGMNDLIRPALYDAWQNIIHVTPPHEGNSVLYDIVGPVCESADFLGKNRELSLRQGDLLAICGAGAYGFSMSSNYNSRPRVAEILVDGDQVHLIRQRETIQDLFAKEKML